MGAGRRPVQGTERGESEASLPPGPASRQRSLPPAPFRSELSRTWETGFPAGPGPRAEDPEYGGSGGKGADWLELGDFGPIQASVSPTCKPGDANPPPLARGGGCSGGRGKHRTAGTAIFLVSTGWHFLPSFHLCLGKVPNCLWGRELSGPHRKRPGPAGGRLIIG